ncbi:MAG: hypothetical protein DRH04_08350 [Deltaproteobacteria bacterium]|nr:MAG: hypothetical protein DRH04_08350 [Deltaproteobacteria bacterium]
MDKWADEDAARKAKNNRKGEGAWLGADNYYSDAYGDPDSMSADDLDAAMEQINGEIEASKHSDTSSKLDSWIVSERNKYRQLLLGAQRAQEETAQKAKDQAGEEASQQKKNDAFGRDRDALTEDKELAEIDFDGLVLTLDSSLERGEISEDEYQEKLIVLERGHNSQLLEIARQQYILIAEYYGQESVEAGRAQLDVNRLVATLETLTADKEVATAPRSRPETEPVPEITSSELSLPRLNLPELNLPEPQTSPRGTGQGGGSGEMITVRLLIDDGSYCGTYDRDNGFDLVDALQTASDSMR